MPDKACIKYVTASAVLSVLQHNIRFHLERRERSLAQA